MNMKVRRIFVEKKPGFDVEAKELFHDLKFTLNIPALKKLRIINRYDISGLSDEEYAKARTTILSEKTVDNVYDEEIKFEASDKVFGVEFLPGQYDQRADSAAQCIQILTEKEPPIIQTAKIMAVSGEINNKEFENIKNYCINTVDSREASFSKPESLEMNISVPQSVKILDNFMNYSDNELQKFMDIQGLAMNIEDLRFIQDYFKNTEKRNPTITEIKVIDTYWSDHCRHTTYQSILKNISFEDGKYITPIKESYDNYIKARKYVYEDRKKDVSLMDMALIGMKELKKKGLIADLDQSEEINACSIEVDADINGKTEKWLVMFKNETHNHPTEIEPFGGAATCIGGSIRDPLSGRTYVYQAMRVTGCADPTARIEDTLAGKLPQKKLTVGAAKGYSSYGNQIGLATGQVAEYYHKDYVAKRMEIGAVIAAAPKKNVVREIPCFGDAVILLGGRTGRDGCGGATGASKEHTQDSLATCGAEVQKGNAPTERKLQRLFRNEKVSTMIKRCNDFGAGGVSVAIGELTDGIDINLDLVPKKYEGLDGTELSISESQERMAVVVTKENAEKFIKYANDENLEAVHVADVTSTGRLRMNWNGNTIVNLSREFLDTNGVKQIVDVAVEAPDNNGCTLNKINNEIDNNETIKESWIKNLKRLNVCSERGLIERFDSSIGGSTILMPFGGKYQATPPMGMAAKLPVLHGETNTATIMTHGFNPNLSKWSPYHGALYAVVEAAVKVVCCGGDYSKIRLTFQEYFESLGRTPKRWGKPFASLLGALRAQEELSIPAIGGKDSMSGTFNDMDVPPTLVAFAVAVDKADNIISPEFKKSGNKVVLIKTKNDEYDIPCFDILKKNLNKVTELIKKHIVISASSIGEGGIASEISKMSFGNRIGMSFDKEYDKNELFTSKYGSLILEIDKTADIKNELSGIEYEILGTTTDDDAICINGETIDIEACYSNWEKTLSKVFPIETGDKGTIESKIYTKRNTKTPVIKIAKPRVFIPVFPGTNCEYDTAKAFERAGAECSIAVLNNLDTNALDNSIEKMAKEIAKSQIIMIPGGFSAGDEPEGSGKFIAAVFRNPRISDAVMDLLKNRDGLMLGICNGFQALIKLGLVPYGEIRDIDETCPTLTYNNIGRHVSRMVYTRVTSTLSPWLSGVACEDVHAIPVSHGEGRFVAGEDMINSLFKNGQIATQYVDFDGNPTYDIEFNPNGSMYAIEGICSPDGRILGKMGHSERRGLNVAKNIIGEKDQKIFESGVNYFR